MAIEVLSEIRAAEESAVETRRVAAVAAKDALKLASKENDEIKDKLLTELRRDSIAIVEAAQQSAKEELDTLQEQRMHSCEELKQSAQKKLSHAVNICIERILE